MNKFKNKFLESRILISNNSDDVKIAYSKNNLEKHKIKYSNFEYKNNIYYYCGKKDYYIYYYSNRDKSAIAIISIKNN